MTDAPDRPQIVLISPPSPAEGFADQLATLLDAVEVACVRLTLATTEEHDLIRMADAVRQVAHARDVAVVIERHVAMAARLGLDGVHLTDGARSVRFARRELGADAIVGAFCGTSKHDGMGAGEAGADYVALGPAGPSALLGAPVPRDLLAWWSEVIEVPVVTEGALTPDLVRDLAPVTDFFAFGPEVWTTPDPLAALKALAGAI